VQSAYAVFFCEGTQRRLLLQRLKNDNAITMQYKGHLHFCLIGIDAAYANAESSHIKRHIICLTTTLKLHQEKKCE
jgi:hypothetical protein